MQINNLNVVQLIGNTIESQVREQVTTDIVERLVDDFRAEATQLVRAEVEKVTLDHVERIVDLTDLSERLNINLNWEDK